MANEDWVKKGNQWEWNDNIKSADQAKAAGYDAYSNGSDANSVYKSDSGNWVQLGTEKNQWSYTSDPNKDSAPSDLEGYRAYRDYQGYHKGESWLDRFARNVNSSHIDIMQDEGSGGGLMYGGFGRAVKAFNPEAFAEEIVNINKATEGGGVLLNGNPSNAALYYETATEQGASIFKSISNGHMFMDGNRILEDGVLLTNSQKNPEDFLPTLTL